MRFETLYVQNFLSFGEENTIQLRKSGLTLIEGENKDDPTARSNGAGKSTIIEALVWCLYGTTLRGYESDEVVHRAAGRDCKVRVVMTASSGDKWVVSRYRLDRKEKNKVLLQCTTTGVDATGASVAETQEKIDKLLGMTVTTFLNSVVFGQSAAYRFSLLTDKQQKDILDEALGTAQYARAGLEARDAAKTWIGEVTDFDVEHARLEREHKALDLQCSSLEKREANFAEDLDTRVIDHKSKLSKLKKEIAGFKASSVTAAAEVRRRTRKALEDVAEDYDKVKSQEAKIDAQLTSVKKDLSKILLAIEKHEKAEGSCTACGQEVTKKQHTAHAETLNAEMKEAMALQRKLQKMNDALVDRMDLLRKEMKTADEDVTAAEVALGEAKRVSGLLEGLQRSYDELKAELPKLEAEESPFKGLLAVAVKSRAKVHKEIGVVMDKRAKAYATLERYEFWVEAFSAKGLRALLIDSALPFLNDKAQTFARTLTDGSIDVEFKTQSELKSGKTTERFEVAVTNKHGAGSYKGLSAGERAKVDLVVGLSLQSLVCARAATTNVVFFDEPFESLDETAVDRVVQLLQEAFSDRESVFVITHNEALKAFFPNSLTVTKEGGSSRVG